MHELVRQTEAAVDPMEVLERVAQQALVLIVQADGAAVQLTDSDNRIRWCAAEGRLAPARGARLQLDPSLSALVLETRRTLICRDARCDDRVRWVLWEALGVRSIMSAPLPRGSELVGVLTVTSSEPDAFDTDDIARFEQITGFVACTIATARDQTEILAELSGQPNSRFDREAASRFIADVLIPGASSSLDTRERLRRVLRERSIRCVYQPIVDLTTGRVTGAEALARFDDPPLRTPEQWFSDALDQRMGVALQRDAIRAALEGLPHLPAGTYLSVNASPDAAADPEIHRLLLDYNGPLVLEITEQEHIRNHQELNDILRPLRHAGIRLAVDDTGAGFASLTHILELRPDIIKLDRGLTKNIATDPVRQALAHSLLRFAAQLDATVIAEGIETAAEHNTVVNIGIRYGQGYGLATPGTPTELHALTTNAPLTARHHTALGTPIPGPRPETFRRIPLRSKLSARTRPIIRVGADRDRQP